VPTFEHANPAFASRTPVLAPLEPALLLPLALFRAAGTAIGKRNILHTQSLCAFFVGARVIGLLKVDWMFAFACAVYNLVRLRNLSPQLA